MENWEGLKPMMLLGLIGQDFPSTFFQMFALEGITKHLHDDFLRSLIPSLVGFLAHATNVVCPVSEFLLELCTRSPSNVFLDEAVWP